jgi:hypothetical protein
MEGYRMLTIFKIVIVGIALVIGVGAPYIYKRTKGAKLKDDNIIEEISESVIKEVIDVDIDITPDSPEKEDFVVTSPSSDKDDVYGNK